MITFYIIPFLWGLAEATIFFIVPDVWLTVLALKADKGKLIFAIGLSTLGALVGGFLVYMVSCRGYSRELYEFFEYLPGIHQEMIERVKALTAQHGLMALPIGVFKGIPYKLFAVEWGLKNGNPASFVIMTVAARAGRFIFSVWLTRIICRVLETQIPDWNKIKNFLLVAFWILFYVVYYSYNR